MVRRLILSSERMIAIPAWRKRSSLKSEEEEDEEETRYMDMESGR